MGDNAFQFQQKSQLNLELCGVSSVLQVPSFTATVNDTSSDQTSDSSESVDHHKVHSVNTEAALLHYCNYITQKKQRLNSKKKKKKQFANIRHESGCKHFFFFQSLCWSIKETKQVKETWSENQTSSTEIWLKKLVFIKKKHSDVKKKKQVSSCANSFFFSEMSWSAFVPLKS